MKANPEGRDRAPFAPRVWSALLLVLLATPAVAQPASPACELDCAPLDLLCSARQHVCQSKLDVYGGYMARMGRESVMYELPAPYRELLQPHFPDADLGSYRFGFGDHQPPDNATTDCDRTYFGAADFVDQLRRGDLSADAELVWLFHELEHVQQCRRAGGRDHYAQMWFGDLETAVLGSLDPRTLHGRMRMERDAEAAAQRVLAAVRTIRDRDGRLADPVEPSPPPRRDGFLFPPDPRSLSAPSSRYTRARS